MFSLFLHGSLMVPTSLSKNLHMGLIKKLSGKLSMKSCLSTWGPAVQLNQVDSYIHPFFLFVNYENVHL